MIQEQFIRETIHAHYLMQLGSYVSELVALPTARLAFTHHFPSIWYNSAYDIRSHPNDVEQLLEQVFEAAELFRGQVRQRGAPGLVAIAESGGNARVLG